MLTVPHKKKWFTGLTNTNGGTTQASEQEESDFPVINYYGPQRTLNYRCGPHLLANAKQLWEYAKSIAHW